jgi:hypothetical protein
MGTLKHTGSCLCKLVRFEVEAPLPGPDACHCSQCRKHAGHVFVSTDVPRSAVRIDGERHIQWYQSSEKVRRGFCRNCGSSLFWDPIERDWMGIAMGAFDPPTNTKIRIHVHVASKGDYYDIDDGLPQKM